MGMEYSSRIDFPHAAEVPPIGEGNQKESGSFTRCRHCGKVWSVRDEFLNDPELSLAGKRVNTMRVFIESATQGLLVFVHNGRGCGSRILVAPDLLLERPREG